MDYSKTEFYASCLSQNLSFDDVDFYSEIAAINEKRARMLRWYGILLITFSFGLIFFVRWAIFEGLITPRFIPGTFPELVILALPFAFLGLYVWYSATALIKEALDEVQVLEKTASKQRDESERLQRLSPE